MAGMPDPKDIPVAAKAAVAMKNRKQQLDAAIEAQTNGTATPPAAPPPKAETKGAPEPSMWKRMKSMITGTNPYVEE